MASINPDKLLKPLLRARKGTTVMYYVRAQGVDSIPFATQDEAKIHAFATLKNGTYYTIRKITVPNR